MLSLIHILQSLVKIHCKATKVFLQTLVHPEQLINEYCIRVTSTQWDAYVASIQTLEAELAPLSGLINHVYEQNWPQGPPQFAVYRLMAVVWRRHCLVPLQQKLIESTLVVLKQLRKDIEHSSEVYEHKPNPDVIEERASLLNK